MIPPPIAGFESLRFRLILMLDIADILTHPVIGFDPGVVAHGLKVLTEALPAFYGLWKARNLIRAKTSLFSAMRGAGLFTLLAIARSLIGRFGV